MAAGNQKSRQLPSKSRLRNPLNVIVEKVGATRAMVHGDVSVESLKELLMSSLSLLPTTEYTNDEKGSEISDATDLRRKLKDFEGEGSGSTTKFIDKENRKMVSGSSAETSDDKKKQKIAGMRVAGIDDDDFQVTGKKSSRVGRTDAKTKSMKKIEERARFLGTKIGGKFKPRGIIGEDEVGEEEGMGSLQSCLSGFSIEKSPFSNDGCWLRKHFEKPLVWGLRDVVKNRPQDPVGYLAFWLRKYRSDEEVRKRKMDFDNELKAKRLSIATYEMEKEESTAHLDSEYYGDGEEEGESADCNFKNYNLSSDTNEVAPEVMVQL